jgi:hypothetical protein
MSKKDGQFWIIFSIFKIPKKWIKQAEKERFQKQKIGCEKPDLDSRKGGHID